MARKRCFEDGGYVETDFAPSERGRMERRFKAKNQAAHKIGMSTKYDSKLSDDQRALARDTANKLRDESFDEVTSYTGNEYTDAKNGGRYAKGGLVRGVHPRRRRRGG